MAKFSFNGMDEITGSIEQLMNLTNEDRMSVIMPAATLVAERQKEKIRQVFKQRTGDLANSITIRERLDGDIAYANIYLKGKHRGSSTGVRRRKDGRKNGKYSGSNAEVGYVLEYGSQRITPRHWMETANEEVEDDLISVQQTAWDDLMKKKGL